MEYPGGLRNLANITGRQVLAIVAVALLAAAGGLLISLSTSGPRQVQAQPTPQPVTPVSANPGPIVYVNILNDGPGVYGNVLSAASVNVVIGVNNTVVWTNQSPGAENIVGVNGTFASGSLTFLDTFSYTFTQPGTYAYYGTGYHSFVGSVIVQA